MIKAEQIPDEVVQVIRKACDSGEPWNIRDTLAAGLAAWPGAALFTHDDDPDDPPHIILPLKENSDDR